MTNPDPVAHEDEDPFADSFASFDEPEVAAPAQPVFALPETAEVAQPKTFRREDEVPFDWFAEFPKAEPELADPRLEPEPAPAPFEERAHAALEPTMEHPTSDALFADLDIEPVAASPEREVYAEPTPAEPSPLARMFDAEDEAGEQVHEPEALAQAPSVPAVFDDAVTEPEHFDLIAAPVQADHVDFTFEDPAPAPSPVAEMIASADAALGEAMVPRIAIHVFAQRAETAAVAQTAAADRRLQRASTAVRPGGLPEALALYASSPTPALVIVENTAPAAQLLGDLDRLAEVCDPGTKVVVIGEANDIGLYRELIRRGVSEYLVPPLNALQLIRTISSLYTDPDTPFVGRTIAFVGAKGGVGSSTLAHNFAWCLAERIEAQACVVDYDLAFGTAGLDFNQDPVQGLHDALEKPDRLDATLIERMLARCTDRLSLFAAPATLDDDYDISAEAYEEVSGKIRSTAPFMVLDLPHV